MKLAKPLAGLALAAVAVLTLTACEGKYAEPWNDSPRSPITNEAPADIVTFPDGFSNAATKCDHGNRIYVIYHFDSPYGSLAVVPSDKTCTR